MLETRPQQNVSLSLDELKLMAEELELLERLSGEAKSAKERFLLFRKFKNRIRQLQVAAADN